MERFADSLTLLVVVCPLPIRCAAEWFAPATNTQMMCIFVIINILRVKLHDNGICSESSEIYTRHSDTNRERERETELQTMGKCV